MYSMNAKILPPDTTAEELAFYDFTHPEKLTSKQMSNLQLIMKNFSRLLSNIYSTQLRCNFQLELQTIDCMTFDEYKSSADKNSTLAIFNLEPLPGYGMAEYDPVITHAIIEKLFGGAGESGKIERYLTDIELSVMERIAIYPLGSLRESLSTIIDFRPRLQNIGFIGSISAPYLNNEMLLRCSFKALAGANSGTINIILQGSFTELLYKELETFSSFNTPGGYVTAKPAPYTKSRESETFRFDIESDLNTWSNLSDGIDQEYHEVQNVLSADSIFNTAG